MYKNIYFLLLPALSFWLLDAMEPSAQPNCLPEASFADIEIFDSTLLNMRPLEDTANPVFLDVKQKSTEDEAATPTETQEIVSELSQIAASLESPKKIRTRRKRTSTKDASTEKSKDKTAPEPEQGGDTPSAFTKLKRQRKTLNVLTDHSQNEEAQEKSDKKVKQITKTNLLYCAESRCKFKNSSYAALVDHILSKHTSLHPYSCPARGCTLSYPSEYARFQHLKIDHKDESVIVPDISVEMQEKIDEAIAPFMPDLEFKCSHAPCPYSFSNLAELQHHTVRKHAGINS